MILISLARNGPVDPLFDLQYRTTEGPKPFATVDRDVLERIFGKSTAATIVSVLNGLTNTAVVGGFDEEVWVC
jgi:hypothetical protein